MKKAILTAVLAAGIIVPASADIVTVTVTGTVLGGVDTAGVFGTPGKNLLGGPFNVLWTINTGCSVCDYVSGYAPNSPIQSAVLTINNGSYTFGSGIYGANYNYHNSSFMAPYGAFDAFYANVTVAPGTVALNTFINTFGGTMPGSITQPFSYTVNPLTDNIDSSGIGGSLRLNGLNTYLSVETVTLENQTLLHAPGPIVGAGLPGLMMVFGWLVWWRRR